MNRHSRSTRALVEAALMIALATILAGLGRWVSLTLSGGLLWYMYMPEEFLGLPMVDPWVYSMIFNGVLIVLVTVVNLIVLGIFQSVPALRQKLLTKQN